MSRRASSPPGEIATRERGDHVASVNRDLGVGDSASFQACFDDIHRLRHGIRWWR
jgi:hypothetical protein